MMLLGIGGVVLFGLSPFSPIKVTLFLALAFSGFLLFKQTKIGIILEILFSVAAAGFLLTTANGEQWWKWVGGVVMIGSFLVELKRYLPILRGAKSWDDPDWFSDSEEDREEDEDQPLISIVLLQKQARSLDPLILQQILSDAWGGNFSEEEDGQFVVGEDPIHIVQSREGTWLIHNHDEPYADPEEMSESINELRLKTAVASHQAWLSVDLLTPSNSDLPLDTYYPYIFRLISELANNDTLVIYRPESGHANVWDEDVAASLGSDAPLENFSNPSNPDVIQVADDDPRMLAAVEKARKEFATFRKRWEDRKEEDYFSVKAPITSGEFTEFIWIEVTGMEPDYIHGKLANDPVNLEGLELDSQVEVPISDLNDWSIMSEDDEAPLGLYTVKVLREIQG